MFEVEVAERGWSIRRETALGTEQDLPGEGVQALARVFMLAGRNPVIGHVVGSSVRYRGRARGDFYKEMGGAPDITTAVSRKGTARARFNQQRAHWTGFILIGDPGN